jgi:hypothetical protein
MIASVAVDYHVTQDLPGVGNVERDKDLAGLIARVRLNQLTPRRATIAGSAPYASFGSFAYFAAPVLDPTWESPEVKVLRATRQNRRSAPCPHVRFHQCRHDALAYHAPHPSEKSPRCHDRTDHGCALAVVTAASAAARRWR